MSTFQLVVVSTFVFLAIFAVLVFSGIIPLGIGLGGPDQANLVWWGTVSSRDTSSLIAEFNNQYKKKFEKAGVVFSGEFKKKHLIEIAELEGHQFMMGVQFHPEFLSSPLVSHPLFKAFMEAVIAEERAK